jgi:hypothetical protein
MTIDLSHFRTSPTTAKGWITPENDIVPLATAHFDYFGDPTKVQKYGVARRDEQTTRLDALRVGFVRLNYEVNGGHLTLETMRWDQTLRQLTTDLVLANAESLDLVHLHRLGEKGQPLQLGCVPLQQWRRYHRSINRRALATWNNFKVTPAPGGLIL